MNLKKGDVVKKKRGGGVRQMRVGSVFRIGDQKHAELLPLASSGSRAVVPLDKNGLPAGYEAVS